MADRYESFRSLLPSRPSRSRLHQIFLNGLAPVACPTTREFRGLCSFDIGIKGGHRSVEVDTIKCGIRGTKLPNDFVMSHGCPNLPILRRRRSVRRHGSVTVTMFKGCLL